MLLVTIFSKHFFPMFWLPHEEAANIRQYFLHSRTRGTSTGRVCAIHGTDACATFWETLRQRERE